MNNSELMNEIENDNSFTFRQKNHIIFLTKGAQLCLADRDIRKK